MPREKTYRAYNPTTRKLRLVKATSPSAARKLCEEQGLVLDNQTRTPFGGHTGYFGR